MAWWSRKRGVAQAPALGREEARQVRSHLEAFIASRPGVEAFVEPRTSFTPLTVVLVATSGEWTRRTVTDDALLRWLSQSLSVPVYDVQQVGYPKRMREYNAKKREEG